jgi:hypothetical protein
VPAVSSVLEDRIEMVHEGREVQQGNVIVQEHGAD